ncbi:MAG TPA: cell division protein FtsZ [Solirubrobacteraceae bacterium]
MSSGKRASMREGPLAALFRKTAQDPDEKPEPDVPAPATSRGRAGREQRQQAAAADEARAPKQRGDAERGGAAGKRRVAPSPAVPEPEETAPSTPSPQERLRKAFSADIPENMLERPGRRPSPEEDVYARAASAGAAFGVAAPVSRPVIRVVGVGGAGVNAINRMVEAEIEGVEFLAINTDLQSLQQCAAQDTLHIGDALTRGLGSGSDPDLGRRAAREEYDRIKAMMRGSDLVFIAAGAGGGTGTGAAPVVAEIARELGALTVGIVTKPFQFEGNRRREQAEAGIAELAGEVDTLIVVPNNKLLSVLDRNTSMVEAFRVADDVLRQGVQGISDLVTLPGLINLDFADVRTIMSEAGTALLGIGMGTGERRAIDAAEHAVSSPLLETSMEGARSILLSITAGHDLSLWEVNEAAKAVAEAAHPDANIIFGAMVDERLEDQVWVTVVATRHGDASPRRRADASRGVPEYSQETRSLREPRGEPRVTRVRPGTGSRSGELDVPEFIPRR